MSAADNEVLLSAVPEGSKFLAILLGASRWPHMPSLHPSDAFSRVAERFRDYLFGEAGLNLASSSVLDLFDSDLSYVDIDARIRDFLRSHYVNDRPNFTDVLVFYTGHGDFTAGDQRYQLILRSTRQEQRDITGYQMRHLARTMNELARNVRKFVILDCCYAAAAFAAWQMQSDSDVTEAIRQEAETQFPATSGTALLCACNEDQWALYQEKEGELTMFGAGLLRALETGADEGGDFLSIADIYKIICGEISGRHLQQGVEPVLHVPKGRRDDLIATPLFPNPALRPAPLQRTVLALQADLSTTRDELEDLRRALEDHRTATAVEADALRQQIDQAVGECQRLAEESAARAVTARVRESPRAGEPWTWVDMTEELWDQCPVHVKAKLLEWRSARFNGLILLIVSCGFLALLGGFELMESSGRFYVPTIFRNAVCLSELIYTMFLSVLVLIWSRPEVKEGDVLDGPWAGHWAVISSQQPAVSAFGLFAVGRGRLLAATGLAVVAAIFAGASLYSSARELFVTS